MEYWKYFATVLLLVVTNARFSFGFKAAVLEHAEQSEKIGGTAREIVQENMKYYRTAVNYGKAKGVEIMVFPEYGLFPCVSREKTKEFVEHVPDPNVTRSNPCEDPETYTDRPILYNLSCLARENEMILVANVGDIQPCNGEKECPEDGVFHFNTDVAFDRDGTILAKYHKEHLFLEPGMDAPVRGQDPTFQTHLGRFAMFVDFDIFFKRVTEVARWEGIAAVLLSTKSYNSGPLVHSFQYFESWAIGNDVNLLAANVHLPGISGVGSGIYRGREGAQVYTFNPDGQSRLLISDLEVDEPSSSIYIVTLDGTQEWTEDGVDVGDVCSQKVLGPASDIYKDYRCGEADTRNFTLRRLVNSSDHVESCNGGMCCTVEYVVSGIMEETFCLGVFNGTYNVENLYFLAEESCFFARCDDLDDEAGVTFPMRSETIFHNVYMRANISTPYVYPSVMSSGMRLMKPQDEWGYESDGKTVSIHFNSLDGKDLLTLGFIAEAYDRDPVQ